jgi:hypothetical protein
MSTSAPVAPEPHTTRRSTTGPGRSLETDGGRKGFAPPTRSRSTSWHVFEQAVCAVTLVLLGWRGVFHFQTSYGVLAGLALLPAWWSCLRKFQGGRTLMVAVTLAILGGLALTLTASSKDRSVSLERFLVDFGLLLVTAVSVAVLLWARTIMSRRAVALLFGTGLLVRLLQTGLDTENPWKFALAIPVTILVLAVADHLRRPIWTVGALLVLGAVSAVQDSRSLFATLLLAAVVVAWQLRPARMGRPASWVWVSLMGAALAAAIYNLVTALLVDGYFGALAQQRTLAQIQSGGSLILGGRPEIAATQSLMTHSPAGFGLGVAPNVTDIAAAKTGMLAIGYDPNNGYVDNYMFGGHVELHSVVGDLWARSGVLGLLLGAVIAVLAARNLANSIHRREASGLITFLTAYTSWNLLFSPQASALPTLVLTLGLGMIALPSAMAWPGLHRDGMTTRPGRPALIEHHKPRPAPAERY